jgi:signal transduction histidine kinase
MRLLIVEDEPIVQELLAELLRDEADELIVAGGVQEARALIGAGFTVALVDKNLPDGSGLTLIGELRAAVPDAAIILMTAYASLDTAIEALRAGAYDYIPKPFPCIHDLVLKVRRAREKVELTRHREALFRQVSESEARFRGLFEASADAVLVHDAAGIVHEANPAAAALYGVERAALIGRDVATLRGADAPGGLRIDRRADGTPLPVEASSAPFPSQGRMFTVEVIHDRREQVRAEAERRKLTEQLHRAMRMESLGRMAGGIAHDFNNTLTVIATTAQLLALELPPELSARCQESLATIDDAATSAATLIRQLLTFSRRQPMASDLVDLNGVVTGLDRLLRGALRGGHELVIAPSPAACWLLADRGQLEQVLMNLVINARDALDRPGTITVTTRLLDGAVELVVADTGCGMPEEIVAQIFEPFFTTKSEGTGLGLATVYGVVQGLNGAIDVASAVGRGTAFTIRLPAAATLSRSPARAQVGAASSSAGS